MKALSFVRLVPGWAWGVALAAACLAVGVLAVGSQRSLLGIDTESDFVGGFGLEARSVLAREPLEMDFHPPGYAFAAALGHSITGSWLHGGLWISGLSALAFLVAGALTFHRLGGAPAAWGVLAACACSLPFLSFASTVSSDMLFAALFCLALALVVEALSRPVGLHIWFLAGFIASLAFLTRTNGLVAAAVLVAPFFAPRGGPGHFVCFLAVAAAFAFPLLGWLWYAHATGSPLLPTENYLNLAVAAYGDRAVPFGDEAVKMAEQFNNTAEVLAHDPARLVWSVTRRLAHLPGALLNLTWLPILLLAVPGAVLMLWKQRTRAFLAYAFLIACITVLSAIPWYENRFFLYLLPLLGGLAGSTVAYCLGRFAPQPRMRMAVAGAMGLLAFIVAAKTYSGVLPRLETDAQAEFAEAIPEILRLTENDAWLYARKNNLCFETGRCGDTIPDVKDLPALHEALCTDWEAGVPTYLYFGAAERRYRKALAASLAINPLPPWLRIATAGSRTDWRLYRIDLSDDALPAADRCSAP